MRSVCAEARLVNGNCDCAPASLVVRSHRWLPSAKCVVAHRVQIPYVISSVSLKRFRRRALACLALFGVITAPLETLIPELHDGDAQRQLIVQSVGDVSASTTTPHAPASGHGFHVDHCCHSHLAGLAVTADAAAVPSAKAPEFDLTALAPPSLALPPHKRPPIA